MLNCRFIKDHGRSRLSGRAMSPPSGSVFRRCPTPLSMDGLLQSQLPGSLSVCLWIPIGAPRQSQGDVRMARDGKVKVGIIGSQFQADIHAASLQIMPDEAEAVAIASPTPGNAAALAKRSGIPRVFTDYREMLKEKDIEMVTIAAPNSLHCQMTKDIAAAGKHIVCEKPLAMTIAEGEEMIAAAKSHGVLLMYGEELLFTPKYLKA